MDIERKRRDDIIKKGMRVKCFCITFDYPNGGFSREYYLQYHLIILSKNILKKKK